MSPTVFLGLVTHRASRFPEAAGPNGLVSRLEAELVALGVPTQVSVHSDDHFEALSVPLTQSEVRSSIAAELDLEKRWRKYVTPEISGAALAATMAIRRAYRVLRLGPPWHRSSEATAAGAAMLRRLVNIELAHLHLLHSAVACGAQWALIVEDDAHLAHPESFARHLAAFMAEGEGARQPRYVNVSRSFAHSTLGLEQALQPHGQWSDDVVILAANRPLTNTVCAMLYRGAFLQELVPALDRIPISPVLPIDWKLNAALLAMHSRGDLGPGDCWFLDPAPITQGSMHGTSG